MLAELQSWWAQQGGRCRLDEARQMRLQSAEQEAGLKTVLRLS